MNTDWTFEHTVEVVASSDAAWAYWSDVENWSKVDPGVEWARLDGPFVAGAHGQTKPVGAPITDWAVVEVEPGARAVIEITVPGAVVHFAWTFENGTRGGGILRQVVTLSGEQAGSYLDAMQALRDGIPGGMARLATAIDGATTGPPN